MGGTAIHGHQKKLVDPVSVLLLHHLARCFDLQLDPAVQAVVKGEWTILAPAQLALVQVEKDINAGSLHRNLLDLGQFTLGEAEAALALAQLTVDAVVAVDTGLAHLSAALDKPTVALYGPTSPGLTGTYGNNQIHLIKVVFN